ncbi:hypothetical protein C7999DRAFT_11878 [Corynascus novoguineensis]|uniref:UBA domain-containing protein n=1 Tax=Corynascus novoguineensis TaxID=1126955 RepID=A0AAN7CYQ0_9PEZI|nr:hypothetical protein C7999DRAFT_11878 [Corynascus novoguineensis]
MAFHDAAVSPDKIETVVAVTGFEDHALISNALRSNQGNVDTVVNEFLDDSDKFRRKYGWDESAFSSGRDGEDTPSSNVNIPSFSIHAPVIYGTEPNNYYGAPSRPPSRANNRSPMSRLADIASAEYTTDRPSNRQEEEDQLQRAINESLNASGIQSPHAFPPPPPPVPQQSGVTTNTGESSVHFGPANRPDYDADEWALVRLGKQEQDSDPFLRERKNGAPVFLRCRKWNEWERHRIGALLMIFQQIPAVRNVLLQTGETPGYGYGTKGDWWQGEPILPPRQSVPESWYDEPVVPWSDEIHRLMAFLELSDRAYGTADIAARASHPDTRETGDPEKDFFQNFSESENGEATRENRETLISSVEIVAFDDASPQGGDRFGLLDLQAPETFYLDRYMKSNGEKVRELQREMVALVKAYDANLQKEERLVQWVNPQTNKVYDRRVITKAAINRCHEAIRKIRHRAYWRKHEQAPADGEGEYYLPEHVGEPSLLPEEAQVIAHYEAKVTELENKLVEIERVMDELVIAERRAILEVNRKMSSLLTVPAADEKWNPKHKYTLCGVVNDMNTVYYRIREPASVPAGPPAESASPSEEERWLKVCFKPEDNTVEHTSVTYEIVMGEACATGCRPILVFATDKALAQDNLPLSDALKSFVRLDNRLFKQELLQSNRPGHKRSAGVGDGSQSKRLQRSASMNSMDTNHASAGDLDDDMRDAPFDNDSTFGAGGAMGTATPNRAMAAAQDENIPDLIDISPPAARLTRPPSYENFMEMETGVSPALAQVSLHDIRNNDKGGGGGGDGSQPRVQEMQERPNAQLLARFSNNINGATATANGSAADTTTKASGEDGPLIDLSDPKDTPAGSGSEKAGVIGI